MSTPQGAPTTLPDASEAREAPGVGVEAPGAPGAVQAPARGHASRKARAEAARLDALAASSTAAGALSPARAKPLPMVQRPGWDAMLADLRQAVPLKTACLCAGLSPEAVKKALEHQPDAAAQVEAARAHGERLLLTAKGLDPKHAQWRLERLYPDRYHLPNRVHLGGDAGAPPVQSAVAVAIVDARALARDDYEGTLALPAPKRR